MYFLWTTKINCRRFSGRLSTNVMTLLLIQIHSETNIFLSTKVIWEREKRGFISYLSAWGSDRRVCLKILPSRKNEIYLWKMATKVGMYSATHESFTVARGQIGKYWPGKEQIRLQDSLPCPLKKNKIDYQQ